MSQLACCGRSVAVRGPLLQAPEMDVVPCRDGYAALGGRRARGRERLSGQPERGEIVERDRYIGFYWTMPVPTHRFTHLPENPDEAAKRSRTIASQRAIVRRWVEDESGVIEPGDEVVFLEVDPDHGTEHIGPVVLKLLDRCRREG